MIPDFELQLAVTIKALRDVVLPAVDPANGAAVEQAQLALATLGMISAHLPYREKLANTELANALAMADSMSDAGATSPGFKAAQETARKRAGDPATDHGDMETARLALLEEMERLLASAPGEHFATWSHACLAAMQPQLDLQRRWTAGAGFDPDAAALPALDDMLR